MNRATLTAVGAAVLAATGVVAHAQTLPAPLLDIALMHCSSARGEDIRRISQSLQMLGLSSTAFHRPSQPPCYLPEGSVLISRIARTNHLTEVMP